jgi:light-regulated signal transduction histidine kinase (bacteriophytochrome)
VTAVSDEQQRAEVEALGAELESICYSVSHDLRAPVRAVIGFARALEEDHASRLDPEGLRLLRIVSSEAGRVNGMIEELVAFSRLGRQPMETAPVDMAALARSVASKLLESGGPQHAILEISDLPGVPGDRILLQSVWTHLISNAAKFAGQRPIPRLEIRGSAEAGRVVYHVRDNGVGFDMAYADQLFGLFQRLHGDAAYPGSGIGLAMVKRIVHRHGGTVWADARPGDGATFSFALPTGGN